MRSPRWLVATPNGVRHGIIGALVLGAVGGVVGLIVGLFVYPPTAWFAVFEIGMPGAVVGFAVGAAAGGVLHVVGRLRSG